MIQQNEYDLVFLKYFLSNVIIDHIIELGTGYGESSRLFSQYAPTVTFDIVDKRLFKSTPAAFVKLDILNEPWPVFDLIVASGRVMLFCDNGDKPREFDLFAPYIRPGSFILVHDFPKEINYDHILPVMNRCYLGPVFEKESLASRIRAFTKIS